MIKSGKRGRPVLRSFLSVMKNFGGSDSLDGLISIRTSKEEKQGKHISAGYSKEFQAMLDSLDQEDYLYGEETDSISAGKKRRLSLDQVKALETNFEEENKLDPDRKLKIAAELGLQPRQVAIWFQNRRARYKTKQLERDHCLLKANYDALKLNYDNLQQEKDSLTSKLRELKEKLRIEIPECKHSVKDDSNPVLDLKANASEKGENHIFWENCEETRYKVHVWSKEESNGNSFHGSNSMMGWFQGKGYDQTCEIMRMEDQQMMSLLSTEEPCSFFSVDQAPSLRNCYIPDQY